MSSSPPSTLGKYQIIREIARSNDIVYEGYDPLMTRRVAVKELNMPNGATPQQAEDRINRFKREAQAAGRLNHPNIMTVYDVEEDGGRLFMAMEYLDGGTLRAEIDGKGKLEPERAVAIAKAVLAGLEHAHSQGVVHRDIKPDNVQILSNGSIKITDFGIARLTFQPNLTMDGQVFGTPSYMSPEQVVGKDIDPRSDLFSVGVMLYEMLAGNKPFAGDSVVAITYAIMNREPELLPEAVPYALGEAVRRSLEKVPHLRFEDAAAMVKALEEGLKPAAPQQPTYDPSYSTPAPAYTPYGGAAPPIQAPYNPYGAPQQVPYPGQYSPPVTSAPAPTYGYNPYTQAPYGGPGPTMAPPNAPPPIYYPPPPRQPLLKPETTAFLKKLTVAMILGGTFVALILVSVWALMSQVTRMKANKDGESVVSSIQNIDPNLPLDQQIQQLLQRKGKLAKEADSTEIDRALGASYLRLAVNEMNGGRDDLAERDLQNAFRYDEHNAELLNEYGKFFARTAEMSRAGSIERAERYRNASEMFIRAQSQETNVTRKQQQGNDGAKAAVLYAYNISQSGDAESKRDARRYLEQTQVYAIDDDVKGQIVSMLAQLRG